MTEAAKTTSCDNTATSDDEPVSRAAKRAEIHSWCMRLSMQAWDGGTTWPCPEHGHAAVCVNPCCPALPHCCCSCLALPHCLPLLCPAAQHCLIAVPQLPNTATLLL